MPKCYPRRIALLARFLWRRWYSIPVLTRVWGEMQGVLVGKG